LFGLSALFLTAALAGAVAWWSTSDPLERILTVVICLLLSTGLTFSVAVAIGPRSSQIPWARVGVVVAANLRACGVTILREWTAQSL
jgi:hypothetical protein